MAEHILAQTVSYCQQHHCYDGCKDKLIEDLVRHLAFVVSLIENLTVDQKIASNLYSIHGWSDIQATLIEARREVKVGRDPAQGEGARPEEGEIKISYPDIAYDDDLGGYYECELCGAKATSPSSIEHRHFCKHA